ncbi:RagB/SusD family nutrient uptake outer membrane protein [Lentiprolixibacter aurantiacus]|uniref:RagB/SusD family nutrient uptake outer membrane protein n=1 Tax=Lentiprolixibacter aurantiacus TaxID=2993939 RepID=A0AAE3MNY6_9FLAO|nr:RagB/SusD family nutrient uptake outer membrane protein [Lentiprolixibacter aurantiacus]MCX2720354.1 RagB/SusD family nutrient uptake outer membrane protein [Lentiprolixibacter aurantiacus]
MKRTIYISKLLSLLVVASLFLVSCESELETEPAQSISTDVALGSEENIKNILIGVYAEIGNDASLGGSSQIMADLLGTVDEVSWNGTFADPREFLNKNILVTNGFVEGAWDNNYETINQANLVIDNISAVESSQEEADRVEGEAKFLRAMAYFDLVRLFAPAFEAGQANTQLGVPLRLQGITDFSQDLDIARSSVADVYNQIISDLNDAYSLLPADNAEFADRYSAQALLARVYFQQGNYAAARDAADDVLTNSGHALAASFDGAFNNDADGVEDLFTLQVTNQSGDNDFIVFYASQSNGGRGGDISIEQAYLDLFDDPADFRLSFNYISPDNGLILTSKYTNQFGNVPVLRIGEMHLIRAESNFREGTSIGLDPLVEINALRGRSNAGPLAALDLDVFFNERQLELAFEGHLIHDVKRTQGTIGGLSWNDASLVLPIPQSEMDTNGLMEQNAGY